MGGKLRQFVHFRQQRGQFRDPPLDVPDFLRVGGIPQRKPQLPQPGPQRNRGCFLALAQFLEGQGALLSQRRQFSPGP